MKHTKDFSAKTIKKLEKKNVSIVGTQAISSFEGDIHFTGTAYLLLHDGKTGFMRTHSQVITMANSSWNHETDLK